MRNSRLGTSTVTISDYGVKQGMTATKILPSSSQVSIH
ncbi:hypothetical protein B4079_4735 [Bacillus cereus]|nr:hypothetical protein B4079_4735 [Bacillus cereus]